MRKKNFWRRFAIGIGIAALSLMAVPTATAQQQIVDTVPPREFPLHGKFIPQHTNGDREFAGHGPTVTVQVFFEISADRRFVFLQICMKAEETKPDRTRAEGCTLRTQFYQANTSFCITDISGLRVNTFTYTDTDHADDVFGLQSLLSNIEKWTITGDTGGDDAGVDTGVIIRHRAIRVTSNPC